MKTVKQYRLYDNQPIDMPVEAIILGVEMQNIGYGPDNTMHQAPHIWALVDTERPLVPRRFTEISTGEELPAHRPLVNLARGYVGTYVYKGRPYHVFDLIDFAGA